MKYMYTFLSGIAMFCFLIKPSYGQTDILAPIVTDFQVKFTEKPGTDSLNAVFTITYSEDVNLAENFSALTRYSVNNQWQNYQVYTAPEITVTGNVVTIAPVRAFLRAGNYELEVSAGSIQDLAGNPAGLISRTFVADEGGPVVTDYTIDLLFQNQNDSVSAVFTITFNEPVQLRQGFSIFTQLLSNEVWQVFETYNQSEVTIQGNVVTITPSRLFSATDRYELVITFGSFLDLAGNMATSFTRTFVGDVTPPAVTDFSFEFSNTGFEDSVGVAFTLTYNEDVQLSASPIVSVHVKDAGQWKTYEALQDTSLNVSGSKFTIHPLNFLSGTGTYELVVAAGAVRDLAGNAAPAFTNVFLRDTVRPNLTGMTPDLSIPVPLNSPFVFTFDEDVRLSPNFGFFTYFWDIGTNRYVEYEKLSASQATVRGNVITFQPSLPFQPEQRAQVVLTANSVLDMEGNPYLNVIGGNPITYFSERFTAAARESIVISFMPSDGDTVYSVPDTLTIAFSENVSLSDTTSADSITVESLVYLRQNGLDLEHEATYDSAARLINIVPATELSFGNTYAFGFTTGLSDALGVEIAANESVFTVSDSASSIQEVAIAEVYGDTVVSYFLGEVVRITGAITGIYPNEGFFIQDDKVTRSGIWVQHTDSLSFEVGDGVTVTGLVEEADGNAAIVAHEISTPAVPVVIDPVVFELGTDSLQLVQGLLVQVSNLRASAANTEGNWLLYSQNNTDSLLISSRMFAYNPLAGNSYNVTGVVNVHEGTFRLEPRLEADIVDVTLTSADVTPAVDFNIYPNPFTSYLTINNHDKLSRVIVTSITGQRVLDISYPTSRISTSDLVSGVYIISLVKDHEILKTSRIIKQ